MTKIVAILNVTPDSFSDGGQFANVDEAIARGVDLRDQGADIVDVGGESTRPGAERVPTAEEQSRVIPVVRELVAAGVTVSLDTMNAETAFVGAQAGASIINDVSGGLADPEMYRIVAETGVSYVAMHWRRGLDAGVAETHDDVVANVRDELKVRLAEMIVWGIDLRKVILDPGLGFAKTAEQSWALLGHLSEFGTLGHPVLVGASRKRFIRALRPEGTTADHDAATATISALAASAGAWGVRVHDVPSTKLALDTFAAWQNGSST